MPSSWCRTRRAAQASSASRTASGCPAGSKCDAGRSSRPPCCMCSICSPSKVMTCGLPLEQRKALLEQIVPRVGPLKYLSHFEKDGEALYEQVVKMGLEGIVAKKADAPYRAGRSPNWLKSRADRTEDVVVVGCTRPKGSRSGCA